MNTQNRYIHTRTGEVVEVTSTDGDLSKVVTVTATGARINARTLKATSLKAQPKNKRGTEWKSAYVALAALREGHPLAPADETPKQADVDTRTPDFKRMTDEELSAYGNAKRAEKMLAEFYMDEAKKELKLRYRDSGAYLNGNVYLEVSTNRRFDANLAKSVLTSQEYTAILRPKPDANLAKEVLTEDRYALICKDHGNKMEIRTATDEDRLRMREREEIENAKANIDMESFYPAEPVVAPF